MGDFGLDLTLTAFNPPIDHIDNAPPAVPSHSRYHEHPICITTPSFRAITLSRATRLVLLPCTAPRHRRCRWADGNVYEGDYKNGKIDGRGTYT